MRTLLAGLVLCLAITAMARGQFQTLKQADRLKTMTPGQGAPQDGRAAPPQQSGESAADQKAAEEARQTDPGSPKKANTGLIQREFKVGKQTHLWRFVDLRNDQVLVLDENGGKSRAVPMMALSPDDRKWVQGEVKRRIEQRNKGRGAATPAKQKPDAAPTIPKGKAALNRNDKSDPQAQKPAAKP